MRELKNDVVVRALDTVQPGQNGKLKDAEGTEVETAVIHFSVIDSEAAPGVASQFLQQRVPFVDAQSVKLGDVFTLTIAPKAAT
jgi:hypothetical protein